MLKNLKIIFVILGILGLLISFYLTILHFSQQESFCPINGNSCNKVLESKYSEFFGVPLSILGIVYYFIVLLTFFILEVRRQIQLKNILLVFTGIGLLSSGVFEYLQFFVIKGFCIYCFSSAVISLILFLISLYFVKFLKK